MSDDCHKMIIKVKVKCYYFHYKTKVFEIFSAFEKKNCE